MDIISVAKMIIVSSLFICGTAEAVPSTKDAAVVPLIVTETDFTNSFDNNPEKVHEFLYQHMWEINLRFKYVVKSNLEIQVVDLIMFEATYDCVTMHCMAYVVEHVIQSQEPGKVGTIIPVEHSPPADNSNCFRGKCFRRGYQIQSVKLEKCIQSSSWLMPDDTAIAAPCRRNSTLLESIRFEKGKSWGVRMLTLYLNPNTIDTISKCLSLNRTTLMPQFRNCDGGKDEYWRLFRVNAKGSIFKLYHTNTRTCLFALHDGIQASMNCGSNEPDYLWKSFDLNMFEKDLGNLLDG